MFEANVSIAFQFEDTSWEYMEEPLFTKSFDTHEEAEEALYNYVPSKELEEAVKAFVRKYEGEDVIAMEAEESITEDGYDFSQSSEGEYFYNTNVWTREDWEDFQ